MLIVCVFRSVCFQHRRLFDSFSFHTPAHSLPLTLCLSKPPLPAVSLAPVSLCRPMRIDGHAGATPSRRRAVPLFPEFFVVVLHCSAALVYSIVRLIVSLSSLAFCGLLERKQSGGRETKVEGLRRRRKGVSIVSLARHSPAFPSVSFSSFLFLWDSEEISKSTAMSPNRGSHGRGNTMDRAEISSR